MTLVNNSLDWVRNHFDKNKVNRFSIVVILAYYYIGLLSYITNPWWSIYRFFISSNPIALVVRALMTALICFYSVLIIIVNNEKIKWKWMIIFIYILLFTLISTAISPQTYTYVYVSKLYNIVHKVTVSPGWSSIFKMYLSSISDFAVAFCLLFVFPLVINNKNQIILLLVPIAFIGVIECVYSAVVEKGEYIKLFEMIGSQYGGYEIGIGATFGNKQDWGAFATVSYVSCLISFVLINKKKRGVIFVKTFLLISSIIIFAFTTMSLCKTAIAAEIFMLTFFVIHLLCLVYKRKKILFFIFCLFIFLLLFSFLLFILIPSIHNLPYLTKVYSLLNTYFLERISWGTIWGRTSIWYSTISNMRTYNLFFGLSKAGVNAYSKIINIEGQSTFHNGFAYFLMSYGVFGFSIYIILLSIVIMRLYRVAKYNTGLSMCLFGALCCAIIFTLSESEVLIVSGSNPIFIFNVLLCTFSTGYYLKEKTINETV